MNAQLTESAIAPDGDRPERIHSPELLANNEVFHRLLTEGMPASIRKEGDERGVWVSRQIRPQFLC